MFLEMKHLVKFYQEVPAVRGLDLDVQKGELLALLGPSGCGKTTTLRMVAGLEKPDEGSLWLDGEEITHRPPAQRQMGMVFQHYALFPNLTVFENVAFGLRARGENPKKVRDRVKELLTLVGLENLSGRYPHQLSGGQ
ncbi:MAG: ATP-binding cassette domain-containing protein, partial [Bacillota bacterium]|nr:ATP-binding cassette domain-containing protein [Bacillota bacterium]